MRRYRNSDTGVVVRVADGKRLGAGWEAVEPSTPHTAEKPKRGRPKKTASK